MKEILIDFLNSIKEYELESGNKICYDERESEEIVRIYLKKFNEVSNV